jgi:hypothetical protein
MEERSHVATFCTYVDLYKGEEFNKRIKRTLEET